MFAVWHHGSQDAAKFIAYDIHILMSTLEYDFSCIWYVNGPYLSMHFLWIDKFSDYISIYQTWFKHNLFQYFIKILVKLWNIIYAKTLNCSAGMDFVFLLVV